MLFNISNFDNSDEEEFINTPVTDQDKRDLLKEIFAYNSIEEVTIIETLGNNNNNFKIINIDNKNNNISDKSYLENTLEYLENIKNFSFFNDISNDIEKEKVRLVEYSNKYNKIRNEINSWNLFNKKRLKEIEETNKENFEETLKTIIPDINLNDLFNITNESSINHLVKQIINQNNSDVLSLENIIKELKLLDQKLDDRILWYTTKHNDIFMKIVNFYNYCYNQIDELIIEVKRNRQVIKDINQKISDNLQKYYIKKNISVFNNLIEKITFVSNIYQEIQLLYKESITPDLLFKIIEINKIITSIEDYQKINIIKIILNNIIKMEYEIKNNINTEFSSLFNDYQIKVINEFSKENDNKEIKEINLNEIFELIKYYEIIDINYITTFFKEFFSSYIEKEVKSLISFHYELNEIKSLEQNILDKEIFIANTKTNYLEKLNDFISDTIIIFRTISIFYNEVIKSNIILEQTKIFIFDSIQLSINNFIDIIGKIFHILMTYQRSQKFFPFDSKNTSIIIDHLYSNCNQIYILIESILSIKYPIIKDRFNSLIKILIETLFESKITNLFQLEIILKKTNDENNNSLNSNQFLLNIKKKMYTINITDLLLNSINEYKCLEKIIEDIFVEDYCYDIILKLILFSENLLKKEFINSLDNIEAENKSKLSGFLLLFQQYLILLNLIGEMNLDKKFDSNKVIQSEQSSSFHKIKTNIEENKKDLLLNILKIYESQSINTLTNFENILSQEKKPDNCSNFKSSILMNIFQDLESLYKYFNKIEQEEFYLFLSKKIICFFINELSQLISTTEKIKNEVNHYILYLELDCLKKKIIELFNKEITVINDLNKMLKNYENRFGNTLENKSWYKKLETSYFLLQ
jgi:hypothetical protein